MTTTLPFWETRTSNCPACGYPTIGSGVCAPCVPMVAAAQASKPTVSGTLSPAA